MAGDDEVYEAAFRRVGVLRVHEVADLFHAAEVLDSRRLPVGPGRRDRHQRRRPRRHGHRLADRARRAPRRAVGQDAWRRSTRALPPYWSHANPVDVLGDADERPFRGRREGVPGRPRPSTAIMLIYTPQGNARPDEMADAGRRARERVRRSRSSPRSWAATPSRTGARSSRRPAFPATTRLSRRSGRTSACTGTPATSSCSTRPRPSCPSTSRRPSTTCRRCSGASRPAGSTVLTEEESKRFVTTYGIPMMRQMLPTPSTRRSRRPVRIGYPGGAQDRVPRRSRTRARSGGVEVGVCSPERPRDGVRAHHGQRRQEARPRPPIEGISVQKMVRDVDYELILGHEEGLRSSARYIIFGAGGVRAEGLADFSVSLPPLNQTLARRMMEETRIFKTMRARRGGVEPPDFCELEELLTVLSNIVVDFPEIAEIDINPLVIAHGKARAVDARIVIDRVGARGQAQVAPHLVITPYPTRYVTPWRLSDGTEVHSAADQARGRADGGELLTTISEESLRCRFFGNVPQLRPRAARALHQHRLRPGDRDRRRAHPGQEEAHHRRGAPDGRRGARAAASSPCWSTTSSRERGSGFKLTDLDHRHRAGQGASRDHRLRRCATTAGCSGSSPSSASSRLRPWTASQR